MKLRFLTVNLTLILLASCSWASSTRESLPLKVAKVPLRFDFTVAEIDAKCKEEQDKVLNSLNAVAAISAQNVSFENTVGAMEEALANFSNALEPMNFLKYVSEDTNLREAADRCERAIQQLFVDIFVREDLFTPIKVFSETKTDLSAVQQRLLDEYLTDFRRNGLELAPDKRKAFVKKKKELVELQTEFENTLVEWKDSLEVTKEELEGMPEDYIANLEKTENGHYLISMKYPDYFPYMENGKNAEIRRQLQVKFYNRGGEENKVRLEKAIELRHELANELGKATHADYVLEERMAKNPEAVKIFLKDLISKLKQIGKENLNEMLELKRKELSDPSVQKVYAWDWRYYENQIKKEKFQIDHQKIKEYFPLQTVLAGMFEIYETLLGVSFEEISNPPKWADQVQGFAVLDKETQKVISYFYMDLFPRQGKYGHAAAFTLQNGRLEKDGQYHIPVSSIVANFSSPAPGNPSLLTHDEVETLFHEFGHIMHQVLTTAQYATFSGTSVKRDFVEAPSQMLENWVWKKDALSKLSGHYKNPSEKLPNELLDKLLRAKLVNVGIRYLRQAFFATLDMTYHTQDKVDSTKVYADLMKEIMMIDLPEGTIPQASFGHLMGGYDAGYYGYLWSEVFAQDMFTRFEKEGIFSEQAGLDYKKYILQPGGSEDPMVLIAEFLGREPNNEAFLKSLGLERALATKTNH